MEFQTEIMLSNRHIHLTQEVAEFLFGKDGLTAKERRNKNIQIGDYPAHETVTLAGPKGQIERVRVMLPFRKYVQAEILAADCHKLGVNAPVKMSGDLDGAATVKIITDRNTYEIPCAIVAKRHIHLGYEDAEELGLDDSMEVRLRIDGIRGIEFDHVGVSTLPHGKGMEAYARTRMVHLDMDEGNAAGIGMFSTGTIIVDSNQ